MFDLNCHKNGLQNLMHKAKKSDIINRDKCIGILKRDKEKQREKDKIKGKTKFKKWKNEQKIRHNF